MTSVLFSGLKHAQLYAKFRPFPPETLISSILTFLNSKVEKPFKRAIDIGCGSGQSTIALSPYFEEVVGFDISEAQIKYAEELHSSPNITYKVSDCFDLPIESSSVELVTCSQSVHWFNTNKLFKEINRVLKPNGVVAAYGYWVPLPKVKDEVKNTKISELILQYLHEEQLGSYWDKERYIVQNHYASITLPFKDSQRLNFEQKTDRSLDDFIGYLSTWSAYQKLHKLDSSKATQILQEVKDRLVTILEEKSNLEDVLLQLYLDYFMIIGRK